MASNHYSIFLLIIIFYCKMLMLRTSCTKLCPIVRIYFRPAGGVTTLKIAAKFSICRKQNMDSAIHLIH